LTPEIALRRIPDFTSSGPALPIVTPQERILMKRPACHAYILSKRQKIPFARPTDRISQSPVIFGEKSDKKNSGSKD
jgi:hypothetical protein